MALLLLHLFHATTVHYKASSCNKGIDLFSFKESMDSSCHETDLDILPWEHCNVQKKHLNTQLFWLPEVGKKIVSLHGKLMEFILIICFLTKTILRLRTQQVFGMQMSSQHYGNYATEC
jgi:hypothetical protein